MTYQVLARKWRPRRFSEIVGQEHVVRVLTHAIRYDRLHHAYLFTGTRGVGKTTIARILAKALNCKSLQDFDPCGECTVCRAVDDGRFVDLLEVDAASRTKVEDTRDLLENVQYAASLGGIKVYLIDEVHMLSGHSFNALLKTLEEPPAHVKFLLATTDPQKIPATVLSRCLQLNLKRLSVDEIRARMEKILLAEHIEYAPTALVALARSADGSLRDGLSLLDQAIAQGAGRVEAQGVDQMLGIVTESPIAEILVRLAENDAAGLLDCVAYLADLTQDFSQILQQLLVQLHRLALIQAIPERLDAQAAGDKLLELAKKISPADLQLYYQIGLIGRRDIDLAPDSRSGFEMLLLRMLAFRPAALRGAIESADSRTVLSKEAPPVAEMNEASNQPAVHAGVHSSAQSGQDAHGLEWPRIIQAMAVNGLAKELASYSLLEKVDETGITLILDPSHQSLRSKRVEQRLEDALQNYYQRPLKLTIRIENSELATPASEHSARRKSLQLAAETSIANDANVRALKETFDAKILPGSTQPREAL